MRTREDRSRCNGPVAIAPAQPRDLDAVDVLVESVYRARGLVPVVRHDLRTATQRARNACLLVAATPDRAIVGTITLAAPGSRFGLCPGLRDPELRLLAVAAIARRRGIGEALVRTALAIATTRGFGRVVLRTRPSMGDACRLYRRLGFVRAPAHDQVDPPDCPALGFAVSLSRSPMLAAA